MTDNHMKKAPDDRRNSEIIRLENIERKAWVLILVFLVLSVPLKSYRVSGGIALGGILIMINYLLLKKFFTNLFVNKEKKISKITVSLYLFKYVFIGVIIYTVIKYDIIHVLGLLVGLTVIVIAITIESLSQVFKSRE